MYNKIVRHFSLLIQIIAPVSGRLINKTVMEEGYKKLVSNNKHENIHKIIESISQHEQTQITVIPIGKVIFNVPLNNLQSFYYQRLISYIFVRLPFRRSIIVAEYFNKEVVFPMKSEWINKFEENGVKFNRKLSLKLWNILQLCLITLEITKFIKSLLRWKFVDKDTNKYLSESDLKKVYFYDFPKESLMQSDAVFKYKNALAWIEIKMLKNQKFIALSEHGKYSNNSLYIKFNSIYGSVRIKKEIKIIFNLIKYIIINISDYKKIYFLFLNFNEIIEYNRIIHYREHIHSDHIYFNCSLGATKPLWAYAAELIDIDNYLYFYATYAEPRFNVENLQLSGEWKLATWTNYIVTDSHLKSELISVIPEGNQQFFLHGVPWWIDSNKEIPPKFNTKIVVLDKSPKDSIYLFSLLATKGGDTFWYQQKFMNDILEACKNLDITIYYKSKRPSNLLIYNKSLEKLGINSQSRFHIVDEQIAPIRLIEDADLVISRAGSSTALIASDAGINSVIYDPGAILNPKDPSIRGGLLVQSKSKLQEVVNQLFLT